MGNGRLSVSSGSLSFVIIIPDLSDAHFHLFPRAGCGRRMLIRQVSLNKNELSLRLS